MKTEKTNNNQNSSYSSNASENFKNYNEIESWGKNILIPSFEPISDLSYLN